MPIKNPRTPYEHAYNEWSYGGGEQRGEPMPRERDFPSSDRRDPYAREYAEYQRRSDEPLIQSALDRQYGGRGAQGIWQGPQEPYQLAPPMDALGTYDPRTSPPPPITDRRLPYTRPEEFNSGGMPGAPQGGAREQEQRRLAASPSVVQAARAYEQRRGRPNLNMGGRGWGLRNRRGRNQFPLASLNTGGRY